MGKLLAINISKERGTEKREVPQAELVADYGIMGDAHAGKWHRHVILLLHFYPITLRSISNIFKLTAIS